MSVHLRWMIVDCVDPEQLAAFWGALLGRTVRKCHGPYVFLATGRSGGTHLGFQRVPEPKRGKNRVHPDLICEDVSVTAAHVEALAGTRVQGTAPSGFLVMADPEGNGILPTPYRPAAHRRGGAGALPATPTRGRIALTRRAAPALREASHAISSRGRAFPNRGFLPKLFRLQPKHADL